MSTPRLNPDIRYWVTSDTHYGHQFVGVDQRGFASRDAHDRHLIDAHNDLVAKDDVVIHLGDVTFRNVTETLAIFAQLKGHYLFVPGNHDSRRVLNRIVDLKLAKGYSQSAVWPRLHEVRLATNYISFCHYPLAAWNHSDSTKVRSFNFHGHLHGSADHHHAAPYLGQGIRRDVGVDTSPNFAPFDLAELLRDGGA